MTQHKHHYHGSCHCKAVRFEIVTSEAMTALQCNCSICIRKNALMSKHKFTEAEFTLISGKEALSVYHWNDKDVNHFFCKHCGIYPFHTDIYVPVTYRVNLGCVDGIEPRALPVEYFDGRNRL